MNTMDAKRILEAVLLCASGPLDLRELVAVFEGTVCAGSINQVLEDIQQEWSGRPISLVHVAGGWRFQSQPELRGYLDRLTRDKPPRYSRAVLETLAVIAYRQPVTRGDMEDIRGVTVNSLLLKQLEDRGWVEIIGHREGVGRPALYATTRQFLDDLGLPSLAELSSLESVPLQFSKLEQFELGRPETLGIQLAFAGNPSDASTAFEVLAVLKENAKL